MIVATVFCCIGGRPVHGEFDIVTPGCTGCCGTSALGKIRKVATATWLFSIWVWLSNWAVLWSAVGYPLALAAFVLSIRIYSSVASGQAFMSSSAARNAPLFKSLLVVCGVLLLLNVVVACVQVSILFTNIGLTCSFFSMYGAPYDPACYVWFVITPVYGVVCAFGMIVLAGLAMDLGVTLQKVVEKAKAEQPQGFDSVWEAICQYAETQAPMYTGGQIIGPPRE